MLRLAVTFLVAGLATAQKVGLRSTLGFGCWNAAFKYNFGCSIELPYNCRCENDNFLATALACAFLYGENADQIDAAYDYVQSQCHFWGNRTMTPQDMDTILTTKLDYIVGENMIDLNSTSILQIPVFVPKDDFRKQYSGAKEARYHYVLGSIFGGVILGYWAVLHLIMTLMNMWKLTNHDVIDRMFGVRVVNWWRHTFTLPPAVGKRHHVPHRIWGIFTIKAPTRGQSIIVLGFLIINLVSLICYYDTDSDDRPLMFATNSHKIMRYMANRCGIIAFSLMPLIVLFASRNNPFIALTGWSYDTFQMYHRWCARMMTIHGIIHGILLTWYSAEEYILLFKWTHVHNWPAGNTAIYCAIIMLLFAIKRIRNRIYEVFVFIHRVFFLVVLVALFVHCSDYGWLPWLYTTLGIYVVEYVGRFTKEIRSGWIQDVQFDLACDNMYRVRTLKKREWTFSAGQFAYIRILDRNLFWQQHPFSLFKGSDNRIEFMCKAKNGATKKVLDMLKQSPNGKRTFKAIIEGPYGREHNLQEYESVFILAGGVGITAMYSYVVNMAPILRKKKNYRLSLVWVLQTAEQLRAFGEEVMQLNKIKELASIQIYITRGQPQKEDLHSFCSDMSTDNGEEEEVEDISDILYYGRPHVKLELAEFISQAKGSIAICACGPPSFVDSTRDTIVYNIRESQGLIHYFEEAFSW